MDSGDYDGKVDTNTMAERHAFPKWSTTDEQEHLEKILKEINTNNVQSEQISSYTKIGWRPRTFEESGLLRRPTELCIGPIHGGSSSKMHRELKFKLSAEFVKSFGGDDKTGEHLLDEIKKNIDDLMKYFDEEVIREYNEDELAWGLFLDGCSVLQFIHAYLHNELKEFGIDSHQASKIREDLFLLENQIPFRVLQLLVSKSNQGILRHNIARFLLINNVMAPMLGSLFHRLDALIDYIEEGFSLHLLDLLH
ncbi:hypothetical protein PanWU01x14_210100 [Parasponia andersonii]|uniref:Uncharacterized protein n=1 Tax=Parasponia andersonii TaxID=3476 RepID=A0A2P5BU28_PARAD|nr:hypothetical protein PanWU01x14_210100 [Parasponia andersonii]